MRRAFLSLLLAPLAWSAERFGASNSPRCPVCRSPIRADYPRLAPVVADVDAGPGDVSILTNARDVSCDKCGVVIRLAA